MNFEEDLKKALQDQKDLSKDIQELTNILSIKKENFLKLQGIVEYLTANNIKVNQGE